MKTYVKMKEFGPVGGGAPETFVCRSATVNCCQTITNVMNLPRGGGGLA